GPTESDLRRYMVEQADHRRTAMLMDREAMYAREAWAFSMDRSSAIAAYVRTLEILCIDFPDFITADPV
nr:hypothetical protein [Tanacetum cinerariifolium]